MTPTPRSSPLGVAALALAATLPALHAGAQVIFSDTFTGGPSNLWSNTRGNWLVNGGEYFANSPGASPRTLTLLPFDLTDGEIAVDIKACTDGGVWIHSDATAANAVLLATAPAGGGLVGFSWFVISGGVVQGPFAPTGPLFASGTNIRVRVTAQNNLFSVFLNTAQNPATTIVVGGGLFHGRVGLYDNATPGQRFDNVNVSVPCAADFNGDGFLDFFDADAYTACFEGSGCPAGRTADFNNDGFVDFFDIDAFLGSFEAGC